MTSVLHSVCDILAFNITSRASHCLLDCLIDDFLSVDYESLGCFKDGVPRALPLFIENFRGNIDWANMSKTVHACAELVQNRGLTIFGIQFYGECWSGVDSGKRYDKYGPSKDCWNGVGKKGTNFVYKIKV